MKDLKEIRLFCLDMDGTIYLEQTLLPHVKETLAHLKKQAQILFLTNNSSKSAKDYVEKLKKLGIDISLDEIYTSGQATCEYLYQHYPHQSVYLVGTDALKEEFEKHHIPLEDKNPDLVVLGYDTTLTYQKLVLCTTFLNQGKPYIATHPDINCPATPYYVPDIGSMMALIEKSTNRTPDFICGKPYTIMGKTIMEKFHLKPHQIAMVGDRLSTDIAFAKNNGFTAILVLSGETTLNQYQNQDIQADFVFSSIADLLTYLP